MSVGFLPFDFSDCLRAVAAASSATTSADLRFDRAESEVHNSAISVFERFDSLKCLSVI